MTRNKLFATFVIGAVVALTALPASARDREDRGPRGDSRRLSSSAPAQGILPGVKTSGTSDQVLIHQQGSPVTPSSRPGFLQKAICSGTCGNIEFTCWGESAYCADGLGCVASGGGFEIILVCL